MNEEQTMAEALRDMVKRLDHQDKIIKSQQELIRFEEDFIETVLMAIERNRPEVAKLFRAAFEAGKPDDGQARTCRIP